MTGGCAAAPPGQGRSGSTRTGHVQQPAGFSLQPQLRPGEDLSELLHLAPPYTSRMPRAASSVPSSRAASV
jgi:hypothetical protein